MRFFAVGAVVIFSGFFLSGYATIASGTTQTVTFISNPEGAPIELDGRTLGKAPLSITLKKKEGQRVTAKLEGYKTCRARQRKLIARAAQPGVRLN